ncbi:hypothetical protein BO1005MUT1_430006 [Hyphomicrobiales bacterium]|nr:hypothetical protein BO1005MUT1_430006 [Hyphomicrobiales bacterium]
MYYGYTVGPSYGLSMGHAQQQERPNTYQRQADRPANGFIARRSDLVGSSESIDKFPEPGANHLEPPFNPVWDGADREFSGIKLTTSIKDTPMLMAMSAPLKVGQW